MYSMLSDMTVDTAVSQLIVDLCGLYPSLDSRALLNKSLVLVKYFIWCKVSKLFYHHDLYLDYRYC